MYKQKKWVISEQKNDLSVQLSDKFSISPLLANLIINRGITDFESVRSFIDSQNPTQFLDPFLMNGMTKAVDRILFAINNSEKIAVYGDYDVDGITSTYILYDYICSVGANAVFYIPDRADEGYGVNTGAIDKLSDENVKLIITVDVGITAVNEVEYARKKGIDFIITDHHTPKEIIPDAVAVINPKLKCDLYPNKNLAGVGVAFKLIYALSGCSKEVMDKYSQAAAIGTIADMVPLVGENRFIASYGIKMLSQTDNPGLTALMEVASIDKSTINSTNISFAIAPRLNAAGRIASAISSVELFLETDVSKAIQIAEYLDEGNKLRQKEEQQILSEAIDIIEKNKLYEDNVIIVAKEHWHHGVIGIVSSKITEKYYKPSAVISISDDGSAKASGRSIIGFNLFDALSACSQHLTKFGGHDLAAGFSLEAAQIDKFRQAINLYSENIIDEDMLIPQLQIDAEIDISNVSLDTAYELKLLEPFGIGNKQPVFCINDVGIKNIKMHKSGKHAFISIEKNHQYIEAPAFNMADIVSEYKSNEKICIAGTMNVNNFRGTDNVQFLIRDLHYHKKSMISADNLRMIYLYLNNYIMHDEYTFKINDLSELLKSNSGCYLTKEKLVIAFRILNELELFKFFVSGEFIKIEKGSKFGQKCNLEESGLYRQITENILN